MTGKQAREIMIEKFGEEKIKRWLDMVKTMLKAEDPNDDRKTNVR